MRKFTRYFGMSVILFVLVTTACGKTAAEKDGKAAPAAKVEADEAPYYAVAMTSGSLFFGHIKKQDATSIYMNDIFYLQRTPPQQDPKTKQQQGPGILLVPQSEDAYGPTDELIVNRQHVLYYQELKEDSKVIEGIQRTKQAMAQRALAPQQTAPGEQPSGLMPPPSSQGAAAPVAPAPAKKPVR